MGGYRVDSAALVRADALLGETSAAARAALDGVRAEAAQLVDGRWAGAAAVAFEAGWTDWLTGIGALLDSLDAFAAALGSSGAGYADTEAAVRTAVARVAT